MMSVQEVGAFGLHAQAHPRLPVLAHHHRPIQPGAVEAPEPLIERVVERLLPNEIGLEGIGAAGVAPDLGQRADAPAGEYEGALVRPQARLQEAQTDGGADLAEGECSVVAQSETEAETALLRLQPSLPGHRFIDGEPHAHALGHPWRHRLPVARTENGAAGDALAQHVPLALPLAADGVHRGESALRGHAFRQPEQQVAHRGQPGDAQAGAIG